ncbi:T9SS type A sorting domain-containing protein [bacterium]|nr:T9SS type A sorting domain-containing protein [bacterium]
MRVVSVRYAVLTILTFVAAFHLSPAQTALDSLYSYADNGVIAVGVVRATGQFRIEASDGTPIQFQSTGGVTGYTNVHIGTNTFTNNLLHRTAPPFGSRAMQDIEVEELSDRVRVRARLSAGKDVLLFQQDFIPSMDGDYAYINIITELENVTGHAVSAGALLMQDVMIGDEDVVDMEVDGSAVTTERSWFDSAVPAGWEATAAGNGIVVRGRLQSATADPPDQFVVGNWQYDGYLGAAVWDYTASGRTIVDHATLLQWNAQPIASGATRSLRTDYGFLATREALLTCSLPALVVNEDSSAFTPYPIPATATVTNIGSLPLSNIDVKIALPPELMLAAGESAIKSIAGPLSPGSSMPLQWLCDAATVDTATPVRVDFSIIAPPELTAQCSAQTVLPPVATMDFVIDCGDTVVLKRSEEGLGYTPDPFSVSVLVRNTGGRALRSLQAELQLPSSLVLATGSLTVPVLPDPLLPGSVAVVSWQLRGIQQLQSVTATYTVRVFGQELERQCSNEVLLPPYSEEPCMEPGTNTAGTDFWIGFLPDLVGSADVYLRVFISAPSGAEVTLRSSVDNSIEHLSIPAGAMKSLEVAAEHNAIPVEIPAQKGLRLQSTTPVHVFAGNFRDRHSDGMTILPTHALGTRYVTAGYNFAEAYEHFSVMATEDGTVVSITPSAMTSLLRPPGLAFDVTLNAGEVYYVKSYVAGSGGSVTGSVIESSHPVAVFSGAESGWVPDQGNRLDFLNPLAEQMIPVRYLGTEYVAVPFRSRRRGDTYRVVATEDNTSYTVNGGPAISLPAEGSWHEDILSTPSLIEADKPVLVAQYANSATWDASTNEYGDGSMLLLVPTDRFMSCHYFPAGMLLADAALVTNTSVSVNSDSWLEVDDTPQLASSTFTAECMVNANGSGAVMSRFAGGNAAWEVQYDFNRARLALAVGRPPLQQLFYTSDNVLLPGRWRHVALVMNGSAGYAKLYLGGQEVLNASFTGQDFAGSGGGVAFGGVYNVSNQSLFWGQLDECRYWQIERSAAQLRAAMDGRLSALDRAGLVGYWAFCDGYKDQSGLGQDMHPKGNPVLQPSWGLSANYNCEAQDDSNFVNLVAPATAQSAITVNYVPLPSNAFSPISGGWTYARLKLPTGINRIETSDAAGIGASSYGFAYHDAYTTYTGFRVSSQTQSAGVIPAAQSLQLHAPYPSPLQGTGTVTFTLPRSGQTRLLLCDMLGRVRSVLLDADMRAGEHHVAINLRNISSGTYILRLISGEKESQRTIVLLR